MPYSLKAMMAVGAAGAARVKLLLARKFGTLIDYEGNRKKQREGVDLHISPWGDVEIKTDTHTGANFFLEYECSGKPSGVMTSKANWYAYYFVKQGRIYMIPLNDLQKYLKANWKWLTARFTKVVESKAGKARWSAKGLAIPRDYICAAMNVVVYEDYDDRLWLVAGREPRKEVKDDGR